MALTPGTRLGVYTVTAQIGEGGMGQVYRATDTKLKRSVAIKILPPSVAADHDRLTRFSAKRKCAPLAYSRGLFLHHQRPGSPLPKESAISRVFWRTFT